MRRGDDAPLPLFVRPSPELQRRQIVNRSSAAILTVVVCAATFSLCGCVLGPTAHGASARHYCADVSVRVERGPCAPADAVEHERLRVTGELLKNPVPPSDAAQRRCRRAIPGILVLH